MSSTKKTSSPNPLPFSPIPVAVLRNDQIPFGARVLLGLLLDYARSDTSTWVSVRRLSRDIDRRPRTVQLWLTSLRSHGWVRFEDDGSVPTGRRIVLTWREAGAGGGCNSGTPEVPEGPSPRTCGDGRNSLHPHNVSADLDLSDSKRRRATTTDSCPQEGQPPRCPDVVVGGGDCREVPQAGGRETAPSTLDLVESLAGQGVTRSVAEELAADFGADQIARQIEALPYRKATDRAATLVSSIRAGWAMPEELRRAEEEAVRQAEERRRRVLEDSHKQLRKLHEAKVAEYWSSLPPEEQERFVEEAIEHADPEHRDFIRSMHPRHPMYRAHRAAVRDEHIRRVLGLRVQG